MKKFFRILLFLILLAVSAFAGYFFLWPEGERKEIVSFIPDDFIYVIESDRPIKDWKELSGSEIWQYLKGIDYLSDVTASANYLDTLLNENKLIVDFVKLGDLSISAHLTSSSNYDFVFFVDLKGKNFSKFKELLKPALKSFDYNVSTERLFNIDIFRLEDKKTKEALYIAIYNNVLLGSYDKTLLKNAILQSEKPAVTENMDFLQVRDRTDKDGTYTLYLNYAIFDEFVKVYTDEVPDMLKGIEEVVSFSSFDFTMKDDEVVLEGYLKQVDTVASFLNVFKDVGKGRVTAQNILPSNTATFTSLGFEDFDDLYTRFTTHYQETSPGEFKDFEKQKDRVENILKIDLKENFFSWMTEEMVTAIVPLDEQGNAFAYYALLHFDDFEDTKENLDFVAKQIKKKSLFLKFKGKDYKGFNIQYLEVKGFFKLFFKNLFSKIEQPHYTFLDEYVVFSNDTTSLQLMIDAYVADDLLRDVDSFKDFQKRFDKKSNIYTYLQSETFYPYMLSLVDESTRRDFRKNKEYFLSFPHMGLQVSPNGSMYESKLLVDFDKKEGGITNWEERR